MKNSEKNKLTSMLGRCALMYAVLVLIVSIVYAPDSFFSIILLSASIFIVVSSAFFGNSVCYFILLRKK